MTAMSTLEIKKEVYSAMPPKAQSPSLQKLVHNEIVALKNKNLFYIKNDIRKIKVRLCNICPDK